MDLFEKICTAIVVAPLSLMLIEGALLMREVRMDADKITDQVTGLALPTKNAEAAIAATAITFAQVGAHERDAFQQQQDYFRSLSTRTNLFLDSATSAMRLFNANILPRISAALDSTAALETSASRNLTDTSIKIDDTIDALRPAIDNAITATAAASAAMSDPAIHETLVHADGVAGNLDATSADIHDFVHRETTPVRGTWNVIKAFLMEFAGPAAEVATAIKK